MHAKAFVITEDSDFSKLFASACRVNRIDAHFEIFRHDHIVSSMYNVEPDILFIDTLPEDSVVELLNHARELRELPFSLVRMEQRTLDGEKKLIEAGAAYVFGHDMRLPVMVSCALQQYRLFDTERRTQYITFELRRLLRHCRFSPKLCGHRCIMSGTLILHHHPELSSSVVKDVYGSIAKRYKKTTGSVEKNIRDAIVRAWSDGGSVTMPMLLDCGRDRAPTSLNMMLMLCKKLRESYP